MDTKTIQKGAEKRLPAVEQGRELIRQSVDGGFLDDLIANYDYGETLPNGNIIRTSGNANDTDIQNFATSIGASTLFGDFDGLNVDSFTISRNTDVHNSTNLKQELSPERTTFLPEISASFDSNLGNIYSYLDATHNSFPAISEKVTEPDNDSTKNDDTETAEITKTEVKEVQPDTHFTTTAASNVDINTSNNIKLKLVTKTQSKVDIAKRETPEHSNQASSNNLYSSSFSLKDKSDNEAVPNSPINIADATVSFADADEDNYPLSPVHSSQRRISEQIPSFGRRALDMFGASGKKSPTKLNIGTSSDTLKIEEDKNDKKKHFWSSLVKKKEKSPSRRSDGQFNSSMGSEYDLVSPLSSEGKPNNSKFDKRKRSNNSSFSMLNKEDSSGNSMEHERSGSFNDSDGDYGHSKSGQGNRGAHSRSITDGSVYSGQGSKSPTVQNVKPMCDTTNITDMIFKDTRADPTIAADDSIASEERSGTMRMFKKDGTFNTVNCKETTTTLELLGTMAKKSLVTDYSKYFISVETNGYERIMSLNERPLMVQKRLFESAGYNATDRLDQLGREDNSYLFRFVFREIGGEVPQECWKAIEVKPSYANLNGWNLTTVPTLTQFNYTDIVTLDFSHNMNIRDLPAEVGKALDNLKILIMTHNHISYLPKCIQYLNLTELDLSSNHIQDISGINACPSISRLILKGNNINELSEDIAFCKNLTFVDVSNNGLTKFPEVLLSLEKLSSIYLSWNQMTGSIPENIGSLEKLTTLSLVGNMLSGSLPLSFRTLRHLKDIDIRGNSCDVSDGLHGLSFEDFLSMPSLVYIRVDANRMRYPHKGADSNLPWIELSKAQVLSLSYQFDLSYDRLNTIKLSNKTKSLKKLDLTNSNLDILPEHFFSRLPGLEYLNLSSNRLKELPEIDSDNLKLIELVASNNFIERIPNTINKFPYLEILELQGNLIKELPLEIWKIRRLSILNLTSNLIDSFCRPNVDDPIFHFDTVNTQNRLSKPVITDGSNPTGDVVDVPIPNNFPPISHTLTHLYISNNRLSDDFYLSLYYMCSLQVLHVAFNDISDITPWVVSLPTPVPITSWFLRLRELQLSGNTISSLPAEIEKMRSLTWLFLNGNKLSTVPGELSKLTKLEGLDIGSQVGGRGEGTGLRYNISNWPYDWNWNWNLELKYLNLSGNKRLEIKPSHAPPNGAIPPLQTQIGLRNNAPIKKDLTDFNALINLRMLGLMDVTFFATPPDETSDKRVRTTGSDVSLVGIPGSVVRYSVADSLQKSVLKNYHRRNDIGVSPTLQQSSQARGLDEDRDFMSVWDLVVPKFRGKDNEALFGIFDGKGTTGGSRAAKYLFDYFASCLVTEIDKLESGNNQNRKQSDFNQGKVSTYSRSFSVDARNGSVPEVEPFDKELSSNKICEVIRRTFLMINRELGGFGDELCDGSQNTFTNKWDGRRNDRKSSIAAGAGVGFNQFGQERRRFKNRFGASATIVYMRGSNKRNKCTMYVANVGDGICTISKSGGLAQTVTEYHKPSVVGIAKALVEKIQQPNEPAKKITNSDEIIAHYVREYQRIKNNGGLIGANSYINDNIDVYHSFGYFTDMCAINASPSIRAVELELDDDNDADSSYSKSSIDEPEEKISTNNGDEFVLLASGGIWKSFSCGTSSYEESAQMMVNVARSGLFPSGHPQPSSGSAHGMNVGGLPGSNAISSTGKSYNNLNQHVQQSGRGGGWATASMKVRDVALSMNGGKVSGGNLVMILGLRDLAKKSNWFTTNYSRRGSAESLPGLPIDRRRDDSKPKKRTEEGDPLSKEIPPPIGKIALVFTDIKNSTSIWESNALAMRQALKLHNQVMRTVMTKLGGYEVKTEGDAFMVSFQTVSSALEFCLTVQGELLKVNWPSEILNSVDGTDIYYAPSSSKYVNDQMIEDQQIQEDIELIFRGLSVRMGIHYGNPLCEIDPITNRMDYYGPMVNRAARVVAASQGGQILLSFDAWKEFKRVASSWSPIVTKTIENKGNDIMDDIQFDSGLSSEVLEQANRFKDLGVLSWCIGEVKLKGLETPETIFALYSKLLGSRHNFFNLESAGELDAALKVIPSKPGVVTTGFDIDSPLSPDAPSIPGVSGTGRNMERSTSNPESRSASPDKDLAERIADVYQTLHQAIVATGRSPVSSARTDQAPADDNEAVILNSRNLVELLNHISNIYGTTIADLLNQNHDSNDKPHDRSPTL